MHYNTSSRPRHEVWDTIADPNRDNGVFGQDDERNDPVHFIGSFLGNFDSWLRRAFLSSDFRNEDVVATQTSTVMCIYGPPLLLFAYFLWVDFMVAFLDIFSCRRIDYMVVVGLAWLGSEK